MPSKCEICDKEFLSPSHLQKHLDRKTPCSEDYSMEKDYQCEGCSKTFRFASGLSRHKKICKGPKVTVTELQTQLRDMQARLDQMPTSSSTTNITNNNINSNNNVTNINITLNNYGHENQDHLEALSYQDLKKILKLTPDHDSLVRMISYIHLNENIPENRTIRLDEKNSTVINVFKRGKWREQNADTVLYDLICRNRLRFVDLEEILSKNMAKGKFEELTQYLCKAEDMANSENADLHLEHAFQDLMSQIREKIAA